MRHSHNPTARHWKTLLQTGAYVNSTKNIGLRFVHDSGLMFSVFADADNAAASNNRRSVSSVTIVLGGTST